MGQRVNSHLVQTFWTVCRHPKGIFIFRGTFKRILFRLFREACLVSGGCNIRLMRRAAAEEEEVVSPLPPPAAASACERCTVRGRRRSVSNRPSDAPECLFLFVMSKTFYSQVRWTGLGNLLFFGHFRVSRGAELGGVLLALSHEITTVESTKSILVGPDSWMTARLRFRPLFPLRR